MYLTKFDRKTATLYPLEIRVNHVQIVRRIGRPKHGRLQLVRGYRRKRYSAFYPAGDSYFADDPAEAAFEKGCGRAYASASSRTNHHDGIGVSTRGT